MGKTSLVSQCLTSDYMNTYDASLGELVNMIEMVTDTEVLADDEYGEKSVSVALDGQEAELTFIDHPSSEMSVRMLYSSDPNHSNLDGIVCSVVNITIRSSKT